MSTSHIDIGTCPKTGRAPGAPPPVTVRDGPGLASLAIGAPPASHRGIFTVLGDTTPPSGVAPRQFHLDGGGPLRTEQRRGRALPSQ